MPNTPAIKTAHPLWASFCIAIGLFLILVSAGIIQVDASSIHAPVWVVAVCGLVFALGGCMLLLRRNSRINHLLAAILCLCFAAVGIWLSLFAPAEGFSGGVPLLSEDTNRIIGRWLFGFGAVFSLILLGYAVRRIFRASA